MAPDASDASDARAADGDDWASAARGTHRITRTPAAAAISLGVFLIRPSAAAGQRSPLAGSDAEVDVARNRLRCELVRDLDLEPVIACRERRQRHGLPRLQLMAERHVERGRQRSAIE